MEIQRRERTDQETIPSIVLNEISHGASPFVNTQLDMSQQKKQLVVAFARANGLQPQLLRYVEKEARSARHMIKQHEFCYPQNETSEHAPSAEYKRCTYLLGRLVEHLALS